jgi:hypothetical protein
MSACMQEASAYTLSKEYPLTDFEASIVAAVGKQSRNYWTVDDGCLRILARDLVPFDDMLTEYDSSPIHSFRIMATSMFSNWAFNCDTSMY